MKISQYAKQAWHQARTNVTYTVLYISGVTLAMLFSMVLAMVLYVKIGSIYPETNRDKTLYISQAMLRQGQQWAMMGNVGQGIYDDYLSKLKNAEHVAIISEYGRSFAKSTDGSMDFEITVKSLRGDFFKIYDFEFLAGGPFASDARPGDESSEAVITDDLASRLFGGADEAIGQNVNVNRYDYRVVGVVRAPSFLTPYSYAQLYCPMGDILGATTRTRFMGSGKVIMTVRDKAQGEALKAEVKSLVDRLNNSGEISDENGEWEINLYNQPSEHWRQAFVPDASKDEGNSLSYIVWLYVVILLVLLIVPALNLSGLIGGRMDTRLSELGIRKTYGATRSSLLRQVLFENILLTLTGGILGMALAWLLVGTCRRWIFSIFDGAPTMVPDWTEVALNVDMLFSPALFCIMLLLCLVVNLLSALVPAWLYMRRPIVKSLYEKR